MKSGITRRRSAPPWNRFRASLVTFSTGFRPPPPKTAPLNASGRAHTRETATAGYFAHESADGSAFWRRIQAFYTSSPWRYWSVGENLLWSSPDVDAAGALRMWLASPEHRANLLNARWREIGVAAEHVNAAPGTFHGLDVTIVTTDFGVRH